ncbi:aspartate aminotransferase family protein [Tepidiforma sp.]|uniref:aspartate aminotransferase family protein n=1 Tax=Tepidiforma sp. TaxID=2682230 RepID=UPI002ADE40D0|nr:aspartate aminotransferase family protein [Tepidiforma sp.]
MTIEQEYIDRHPGSRTLAERAAAVLPSGVTHDSRYLRPFLIYAERADGAYKWDVDGHRYIDYVVGHGALLLGHNHPVVTAAVHQQLARGTHYGASHELEIAWAEEVVRIVPAAEVVRFTSSGTEATLMALRLARAATGRPAIVKFERHFHGWHDYVVPASSYAGRTPPGIPESTLDSVIVLPPNLEAVEAAFAERSDIGAVIVEAPGASSGQIPLPPGFLQGLQTLVNHNRAVVIMDEVVSGFRWAPGGVHQLEGVQPDLVTLAKILAGGLPGGAVAGRRDLLAYLQFPGQGSRSEKVGHPGTFNANPLSAAAGVACLRHIADGSHQQRAASLAATLRAGMNRILHELAIPAVVYGQSSAFRVHLAAPQPPEPRDYDGRELPRTLLEAPVPPEPARLLQLALLNHGVQLFGTGGMLSSAHTEADIAATLDAWRHALLALLEEGHVRPA